MPEKKPEKKTEVEKPELTKQQYRAKQLLKELSSLDPATIEDIVIGGEEELAKRDTEDTAELVHITDIADEIEEEAKTWGKVSGISTGLPALDNKIGGLKKGHLILIGGESGNGKSALAQNIAVNVGKTGKGVLFITLEMLMAEAGARIRHMNDGTIDDLNIMFQKERQLDYRSVDALFKRGIELGEVELVVLDYFQYLGRGMTNEEVAKMSKLMKSLALKYELPFIVIVSLRKGEGGKFKRKWTDIELDDLMGTSALGYDTDVALIASRKNQDNEYDKEHFFVKILKTRNMDLDYDKRYIVFDWDKTKITTSTWDWLPETPEYEPVVDDLPEVNQPPVNVPLPYKD